jgi:hypothetical protein
MLEALLLILNSSLKMWMKWIILLMIKTNKEGHNQEVNYYLGVQESLKVIIKMKKKPKKQLIVMVGYTQAILLELKHKVELRLLIERKIY